MSQYAITIPAASKDKLEGRFVYGFDRILSEYFWQEWGGIGFPAPGPVDDKDPGPDEEFGCINTSMWEDQRTAGDLRDKLMALGVWDKIPEEHRVKIMGDLPI